MAAIAESRTLIVHPNSVQIGNSQLPIGPITTIGLSLQQPYIPHHQVRVWTNEVMGSRRKEGIIDFQFETAEKTYQFFRDLVQNAKAPFSLNASEIRTTLRKSDEGTSVFIRFVFGESREQELFDKVVAPIFFKDFKAEGQMLISPKGKEREIIAIVNRCFEALNEQTHLEIGRLLWQNRDHRFSAETCDSPSCCEGPGTFKPHYVVDIDGTVKKYTLHFGRPPEDFPRTHWDSDEKYYAPEPLKQPTEQDVEKFKEEVRIEITIATEAIATIPDIDQVLHPWIENRNKLFAHKGPIGPVEWAVLRNSTMSDPIDNGRLSRDQEEQFALIANKHMPPAK